MNKLSRNRGFTLVELMVVISIIAILSIIGAVVYSSVQIQSRDNKRVNDLKTIEAALEQYYSDQNSFPVTLGSSISYGSTVYLSQIPQDPLGSPGYFYQSYNSISLGASAPSTLCDGSTVTCNVFCLSAHMEGSMAAPTPYCPLTSGYNYQVNSVNPNNNIKPS